MKADLTRNTFNPLKHFSRVLMQQGRVQLDADWNEQAAILLRYLQTLAADLIGDAGGPRDHCGFGISALPGVKNDFEIGSGRYYVDGILCEADGETVSISFVSKTLAPAMKVKVDQWTLDGKAFEVNQYLELFDDSPRPGGSKFTPIMTQIQNVDEEHQQITLQSLDNSNLAIPDHPALQRLITYVHQPDYPDPDPLPGSGDFIVYLDVWERHITYVEDDSIREVALGGPDTATRGKVVWQVKIAAGQAGAPRTGSSPCDHFTFTDKGLEANLFPANRGKLKAMAKPASISTDPCIIPPDASYRGEGNQLYRVEIHRSGTAWDDKDSTKDKAATFKWSRENGSVVLPVVNVASSHNVTNVTLESLGRDSRFGLTPDDWVELQNDDSILQNRAANLLKVDSVDRSLLKVGLSGKDNSNVSDDQGKHPLLRRWDQKEGDPGEGGLTLGSDNAALIQESSSDWLVLEDGVQIQFQPSDDPGQPVQYRTGDYWLIPARTATGNVEWPTETVKEKGQTVTNPIAKPPDGVQHRYAPLGVVNVTATGLTVVAPDCRKQFDALAQLSK